MQVSFDLVVLEVPGGAASLGGVAAEAVDCTCEHMRDCGCGCHDHFCDPAARHCDRTFLPDEAGYTRFGCVLCTPGALAAHLDSCALIGWFVPFARIA